MLKNLDIKTFNSNGFEIAYYDEGEGEPVLLIHGFASNAHINWVYTSWFSTLKAAGYRVIAFDHRGHGKSQTSINEEDYSTHAMAQDGVNLLNLLGITQANVMGYSMGGRVTAMLAAHFTQYVKKAIIAGIGTRIIEGGGLPPTQIRDALLVQDASTITNPTGIMFRKFGEQTRSHLPSLAACIMGSRQALGEENLVKMTMPILVVIGTEDHVAGEGHGLVSQLPDAKLKLLEGKNHMNAVGDKEYKAAVLEFLSQ